MRPYSAARTTTKLKHKTFEHTCVIVHTCSRCMQRLHMPMSMLGRDSRDNFWQEWAFANRRLWSWCLETGHIPKQHIFPHIAQQAQTTSKQSFTKTHTYTHNTLARVTFHIPGESQTAPVEHTHINNQLSTYWCTCRVCLCLRGKVTVNTKVCFRNIHTHTRHCYVWVSWCKCV